MDVAARDRTLRMAEKRSHRRLRETEVVRHTGVAVLKHMWCDAGREGRTFSAELEIGDRIIALVNTPLSDGGWVSTQEDVTSRIRAERQIVHLAHHDSLTNLPNRTAFNKHLASVMEASIRLVRSSPSCRRSSASRSTAFTSTRDVADTTTRTSSRSGSRAKCGASPRPSAAS